MAFRGQKCKNRTGLFLLVTMAALAVWVSPAFAAMPTHVPVSGSNQYVSATLDMGFEGYPWGHWYSFPYSSTAAVVTLTAESFSDSPVTLFKLDSNADGVFDQESAPQSEYDGVFYTSFTVDYDGPITAPLVVAVYDDDGHVLYTPRENHVNALELGTWVYAEGEVAPGSWCEGPLALITPTSSITGDAPLTVDFTLWSTTQHGSGQDILSATADFDGDGVVDQTFTYDHETEVTSNASFDYTRRGNYTPIFTVFDEFGFKGRDVIYTVDVDGPEANAGQDKIVIEGRTVTLDATASEIWSAQQNRGIASYEWEQTAGPAAPLSSTTATQPRFVAPPVTEDTDLEFTLTVTSDNGATDTDTVTVTVQDNGITDYGNVPYTVTTSGGQSVGIAVSGGSLTMLETVDVADLPEVEAGEPAPASVPYGLFDFELVGDTTGFAAEVTVNFPEALPEGYQWWKFSQTLGWYDYTENVVFSEDRTQVTIMLEDNGIGDDESADMIIRDPSGPAGDATPTPQAGSGDIAGCFIKSLFE